MEINKKYYLKLITFAVVLFTSFSFLTSCSDDDKIGSASDLAGTSWVAVHSEGYIKKNGKTTYTWDEDMDNDGKVTTFNSDNTISYSSVRSSDAWAYEEGVLTIVEKDEDATYYRVLTLNSSNLVFDRTDKEDSYEYYEKMTYRRVN
jgi:hypothetical protein